MSLARSVASSVSKTVAKPVNESGVSGGAAPLDIRASVGTSTSPTSTGLRAVTDVGFPPKVVLPFSVNADTEGALVHALAGFGAMTGSAQSAIAVSSRNGQTSSATNRRHAASAVASFLNSVGSDDIVAARSSLDANGHTYNYTTVQATARILNEIRLGGADLEVSLTQHQMNGTNAAQSFAHGLSGAPTGVLFFGFNNTSAPPFTTTSLYMAIGAWAGGNQFGAIIHSLNGVTTTTTRRALYTNTVGGFTDATIQRTMSVASVDATNVNVTYPVTIANSQVYIWMLAIRGAKCQVGTFDPFSGSTITCSGITPKLFLPVFVPAGVFQSGTVNGNLMFSVGACDGTNNVSCGITDETAKTTTNARRFQSSNSLCVYSQDGAKQFEATAAFSGESVVLTRPTNAQYYGEMGYLVIGS